MTAEPAASTSGASDDLERVGRRVDQLLDEVGAAEPAAAEAAAELVSELLALYGTALGRILGTVTSLDPDAAVRLAQDPLVGGLFSLHDLHPVDVATRVERALDEVRPYLESHGGDVELVEVRGDVVRLRLKGSCSGCGASATTLEMAVDGAIRAAAPEIDRLEVEGAVVDGAGLIPLQSLYIHRDDRDQEVRCADEDGRTEKVGDDRTGDGRGDGGGPATWTTLATTDIPTQRLARQDLDGHRIVLGRIGSELYAYREACPACGTSLDGVTLEDGAAPCVGCGRRYDLRRAGRLIDAEGPGIEPVPLIEQIDGARVALGAAR